MIKRPVNRKRTINFTIARLRNINERKTNLGLITCKKWHSNLLDYFNLAYKSSPQFRTRYGDLRSFLLEATESKDTIKFALSQNFIAGFNGFIAKKLGIPNQEIMPYTMIFITLFHASLKITDLMAKKQPYDSVIREANENLALFCQNLPVEVRITA